MTKHVDECPGCPGLSPDISFTECTRPFRFLKFLCLFKYFKKQKNNQSQHFMNDEILRVRSTTKILVKIQNLKPET